LRQIAECAGHAGGVERVGKGGASNHAAELSLIVRETGNPDRLAVIAGQGLQRMGVADEDSDTGGRRNDRVQWTSPFLK
jgi:hypothetical protein